jgi:MinD superfamily P-loop ATPase
MRELAVLSGKGGSGKTSIAAALADLARRELSQVLADTDVDAANLELVLAPSRIEQHDFTAGQLAVIDPDRCTSCSICADVCRFAAIVRDDEAYRVDEIACEGCAACFYQCPAEAIRLQQPIAGRWFRSLTSYGPLFHAHLFAGQENSGKLVTRVKEQARQWALANEADLLLVDGPPGIGCPVIAASAGADLALLVVEPTVSGIHDLERILATTRHFGIPALVCINKADLNDTRTQDIAAFCETQGIELVGRVPFDHSVTEAMVQGQPVTAYNDGPASRELRAVCERILQMAEDD